jgi:hypothetical protein
MKGAREKPDTCKYTSPDVSFRRAYEEETFMATAYTTYTVNREHRYSYYFVCEHCEKSSEPQFVTIETSESTQTSGNRRLTMQEQQDLQVKAQERLALAVARQKAKFENGNYGAISGTCPHCGKRQSWKLKGRWLEPWKMACAGWVLGMGVGGFIFFPLWLFLKTPFGYWLSPPLVYRWVLWVA